MREGWRMAAERIGLGVIGCGVIAGSMYLPFTNREVGGVRVELAAVADVDGAKAETAKERNGARSAYTDPAELLADPAVEAVVIATNIATHAELALAAVRAGKHLLVQKPLAETLDEADRIIAEADAANLLLQVEPAHALNPLCVRARELIAAGALGELGLVQVSSAHRGAEDRPWLFQRSGGGSVMLDLAVHALTWAVALAGPARTVTALMRTTVPEREIAGQRLAVDIDDNVALLLEFAGGALGAVVANYITVADAAAPFSVYGAEGTLHIDPARAPYLQLYSHRARYEGQEGWLLPTVFRGHRAQLVPPAPPVRGGEPPAHTSLAHFVGCIAEGRQPVPDGRTARHVLEIMVRGAEAAKSGARQELRAMSGD